MEDKLEHAKSNAAGWLASIEEMLENVHDWQAAAEAEGWTGPHKDKFGATFFNCDDDATWACPTWKDLCKAQDIEPEERSEDGEQTIHESVLSVMVRDGWRQPDKAIYEDGPEEYEILLTTGGPALRIWGKLGRYGEPETAELQMQDWFTPWTRFPAPEATLLEFARYFYFSE